MKKRMTTIRCEVSDILKGAFDKEDGPRVISPYGVEMRRVALIGFVVGQYSSEGFSSITIDDSSGTIRSKGWGGDAQALNSIAQGSFVLVIGKIREYEGERYIAPEIIRSVDDPNILTLHKLERLRTLLQRSGASEIEVAGGETSGIKSDGGLVVATPPAETDTPTTSSPSEKISATAPLRQQILQFIRQKGVPVSSEEVLSYFVERGFQKKEITHRLLDLLEDGSIIEDPIGVFRC
ncbi:MAG: OB-fold nucleic acid binding domain-containing protein [Candidatus Thorarchaeota archaeon]